MLQGLRETAAMRLSSEDQEISELDARPDRSTDSQTPLRTELLVYLSRRLLN